VCVCVVHQQTASVDGKHHRIEEFVEEIFSANHQSKIARYFTASVSLFFGLSSSNN
jgi:hypothetical protein